MDIDQRLDKLAERHEALACRRKTRFCWGT
jgi:hypothetical protein